jgi:hypothetical protein
MTIPFFSNLDPKGLVERADPGRGAAGGRTDEC